MTDTDIKIVLELLHKRILHSKFAEDVTEAEVLALVEVIDRIDKQKTDIEIWRETAEQCEKAYESWHRTAELNAARIVELEAEIERLKKARMPTETSGFKIEKGKVVFYTNMLNGYRHEYENLDEVVKELNLMLKECYKNDDIISNLKGILEKYQNIREE